MIWKNLRKKILPYRSRTGRIEDMIIKDNKAFFDIMQRRFRAIRELNDNEPRTGNPQGKVGVLEYVPTFAREFKGGNKKWVWNRFGAKSNPFYDGASFIKALEKRGFKHLGSGAFATVLAKDGSDKVIKVIRRPDGWINYVHWAAQAGEAGHFAPKVFSYKKIKGKKRDFAVAIVERLQYTLEDAPNEHALKLIPQLVWRAEENAMAAKFVEQLAPGLMNYLKKMGAHWKIPVQNFDLHDGNLMLRKDGSFVVVDPVSRGEEVFNRLREGDFGPPTVLFIRYLFASSYRYRSEWTG